MSLAAVKTFVAGEILFASDLNAMNTNILNNPLSLVSPLTGSLDVNANDLLSVDEVVFVDATTDASAAGRLRRNGVNLTWHNGTAAARILTGTGGSGDIILAAQIFS